MGSKAGWVWSMTLSGFPILLVVSEIVFPNFFLHRDKSKNKNKGREFSPSKEFFQIFNAFDWDTSIRFVTRRKLETLS